jgi:hypothetical protein
MEILFIDAKPRGLRIKFDGKNYAVKDESSTLVVDVDCRWQLEVKQPKEDQYVFSTLDAAISAAFAANNRRSTSSLLRQD